jgi:pyruvate carboxylase
MADSDEDSRKEVAKFEALAETAYNDMYDSRAPAGCYSDLKDYFAMAIGLAERAGLHDDAKRLSAQLDHCKKVYRSQFSGF